MLHYILQARGAYPNHQLSARLAGVTVSQIPAFATRDLVICRSDMHEIGQGLGDPKDMADVKTGGPSKWWFLLNQSQ